MNRWEHAWYAYEPPRLLRRVEEEAPAALPGGTGPGALTGAFVRTTGASRDGGSRGRGTEVVTAVFSCP
jgi:hypothetical protein